MIRLVILFADAVCKELVYGCLLIAGSFWYHNSAWQINPRQLPHITSTVLDMSQTNSSYILYSVVCFFNQMFGIFLMMMICVDNFLLIDASIKRLTDLEFSSFCKLQTFKNHENCLINCLILCLIIDWIIHTALLSFFIAKMCISAFSTLYSHPK